MAEQVQVPQTYVIVKFTPESIEGEYKALEELEGTRNKIDEMLRKNREFYESKLAWLEGLLRLYAETGILEKAVDSLSSLEQYKEDKKISPDLIVQKFQNEEPFYRAIVGIYLSIVKPYEEWKEMQIRKAREKRTEQAETAEKLLHGLEEFATGVRRAREDPRN